jgi:hypothetical protein
MTDASRHPTSTKQPVVFLFCYRFFDIRLLVSAGVILELSRRSRVVLFAPSGILPLLRSFFGDAIALEPIGYGKEDFDDWNAQSRSWRERFLPQLRLILGFIYGNQSRKPNLSATLHIRSYLTRARRKGRIATLKALLAATIAKIASGSYPIRRGLQALYAWSGDNRKHAELYSRYHPDLVVTATFGLSVDGLILAEARAQGVRTCAIVQSWDKTSTKGYPAVPLDAGIVWSHVTAEEARVYFDMKPEQIFVEGAPLWDPYFRPSPVASRAEFLSGCGLDSDKAVIFFSVGSPCYHEGNKVAITMLLDRLRSGAFAKPAQLLIRTHPGYLTYDNERADWEVFIAAIRGEPGVAFADPDSVEQQDGYYLVEEQDFSSLRAAFTHCDVSISIASSHLIESAIFDKPAINIEYGRWVNEMYDFDLSEYTAEHLYRIYRCNAVYRAFNDEQLLSYIDEALLNPGKLSSARRRLIDQEIPVNRGTASAGTAERLAWLAREARR